jgi:hypothetical protein
MRRVLALLTLAALAAAAPVRAQDAVSPAFAPLSGGARAFALSGAAVALTEGADAAFVNPARLAFTRATGVSAGYGRLVEGLSSDRGEVSVALPLGESIAAPFQREGAHRWTLGLALDYQRLELSEGSLYGEATATLAAALAPTNIAAVGAAVRGLRTGSGEVEGLEADGLALDLGLSIALLPCLEAAVAAHNVAGRVRYQGRESEKPGSSIALGLALTRWRWAALEADYVLEYQGGAAAAAGIELTPIRALALRGGLRQWLSPETRSVPSAGLGLRHNGYFLDYGVQLEGEESLGMTHRVSLGVRR